EGWLLLISDSLIQIPIAKFMTQINQLRFEEIRAQAEMNRARGRGTVAETMALRKLQAIQRRKQHYERALTQVLLSSPEYLKSIKKKKDWQSRDKGGNFEKLIRGITPHTIKERAWLDEMRKKLSPEEGRAEEPAAKVKRPRKKQKPKPVDS